MRPHEKVASSLFGVILCVLPTLSRVCMGFRLIDIGRVFNAAAAKMCANIVMLKVDYFVLFLSVYVKRFYIQYREQLFPITVI